ncbi:paxillin homolog 1 isoform X1 [Drosophila elegans]|uniref:paxillin homolog 1 isoform X1 n=1 Tax=Drosophila elegans TaxID=30023 RepID=UPI0007E83D7F|nr:paxillin homolog 1 isoform X1 [Drosophila elegans]
MESLDQKLRELSILKDESLNRAPPVCVENELVGRFRQKRPSVPPKPPKKNNEMPQVPSSKQVCCSREPLYSQPLLGTDKTLGGSMPLKKHNSSDCGHDEIQINSKATLDNPAILEQQLEALAYHKLQMEKKGLLGVQINPTKSAQNFRELPLRTLSKSSIYSNINSVPNTEKSELSREVTGVLSNTYSNVHETGSKDVGSFASSSHKMLSVCTNLFLENDTEEDDVPPPPSPESAVSSSYSELRRASTVFNKPMDSLPNNPKSSSPLQIYTNQFALQHGAINKNPQTKTNPNYYCYGGLSQSSSTYDSIYEPINPRPAGDLLPRESCNPYGSYVNDNNISSSSCNLNIKNSIEREQLLYAHGNGRTKCYGEKNTHLNNGDGISNNISLAPDSVQEFENYGRCVKCNSRVLGESSGCTAMDQIYHISCFTCTDCQINLQGKPFYALDGKPYCESDYLQTLEKCSVCMEPILERILRATGKPYHPQCFTCVVCGKSLDGLLFTVDATNQNYCITDFHKKFAPRCCVCKEPIMPDPGQEETVRVVALDRSFHLECYKCEDCGLLLSSEAEGRGCYPLDDHVLCKSCNAQRVQVLTKRMTSEH